jgi:hypothetical protein
LALAALVVLFPLVGVMAAIQYFQLLLLLVVGVLGLPQHFLLLLVVRVVVVRCNDKLGRQEQPIRVVLVELLLVAVVVEPALQEELPLMIRVEMGNPQTLLVQM